MDKNIAKNIPVKNTLQEQYIESKAPRSELMDELN